MLLPTYETVVTKVTVVIVVTVVTVVTIVTKKLSSRKPFLQIFLQYFFEIRKLVHQKSLKTQTVIQLKNSNCHETQKLKL